MSRQAKISHQFHHRGRFVALLVAAELKAQVGSDWAFVGSIRERFEAQDVDAILTKKERNRLYQISGWGE